jgi:hypothetical protein
MRSKACSRSCAPIDRPQLRAHARCRRGRVVPEPSLLRRTWQPVVKLRWIRPAAKAGRCVPRYRQPAEVASSSLLAASFLARARSDAEFHHELLGKERGGNVGNSGKRCGGTGAFSPAFRDVKDLLACPSGELRRAALASTAPPPCRRDPAHGLSPHKVRSKKGLQLPRESCPQFDPVLKIKEVLPDPQEEERHPAEGKRQRGP